MFGWCMDGKHKDCWRKVKKWHWDTKMKNVIVEDDWDYCDCKAKNCPCSKNDATPVAPKEKNE